MKPIHVILSLAASAITSLAADPVNLPSGIVSLHFAEADKLYFTLKKQLDPVAAAAVVAMDVRTNVLILDAGHPGANEARQLITKLDQGPLKVAQEKAQNFGTTGIKIGGARDFRSIAGVWPDTPAFQAGIREGDYILAIDGADTRDFQLKDLMESLRGQPGTQVILTVKQKDSGKIEQIALTRIPYDDVRKR
jgi:hypothetical protein